MGWGLGCIVPADLQGPQDHRPVVLIDLTLPNPQEMLTLRQRSDTEVSFVLWVTDPDDQTLTVRGFIDARYARPIDPASNKIPPNLSDPEGRRGYVLDVRGLCDELVDFALGMHTLELYISDEGFVDSGRDLRIPNPGGFRDSVLWRFECIEPFPQGAAGGVP